MASSANAAPKRSVQACSRCRQQKMKCSGDPAPCERCARFGRECNFEPANTTAIATTNAPFNATSTQQQHPPLTPSDGSYSLESLDLPPRGASRSRKRNRGSASTGDSWKRGEPRARHGGFLPGVTTPYSSVQELEVSRDVWSVEGQTPSSLRLNGDVLPSPQRAEVGHQPGGNRNREALLACLAEADLAVADAQELFTMFGERLSPFIPSFYATGFKTLPDEPVYALAAIHAVARYLPASTALRYRLCRILRRLISDLILQPTIGLSRTTMVGRMQGLVILYSCCEATGPDLDSRQAGQHLDMLSLKGIVETYAVKLKIGAHSSWDKECPEKLSLVWVVWLYTMSHHSAVIHGCPRTLSGSTELLRAKATLEQTVDHPRIRLLLGECELCLLWEKAFSDHGGSPETVSEALDQWYMEWQEFLNGAAAQGRQLYFHFFFTRFHLLTHLVDEAGECYVAVSESLDAARNFLWWVQSLSPISKDRLRYLCDFAFVLMAYVCLYVLRALNNGVVLPARRPEFLRLVREVAALMQSFGARADTRPIVYGCALEAMCKQYQSTQSVGWSTGAEAEPHSASGALHLSRFPSMPVDLALATDAPMDPSMLPQSRLSPELWTLDPDLSVFDGIMAGIPVPEESVGP